MSQDAPRPPFDAFPQGTPIGAPRQATSPCSSPETEAHAKAAGIWLGLFARTLKTCRLYAPDNPSVARFRGELAHALSRLLEEQGEVTFRFSASAVTVDDQVVHEARSREDQLAFAFHRDGVRALTFRPGVTVAECESLLDAVLAVTGQNLDGDDLVTLLWEAHLAHVEVDYVPASGGAGGNEGTTLAEGEGALLPWPTTPPEGGEAASRSNSDPVSVAERSEDWAIGQRTDEVEATFAELDFMAPTECERFRREHEAERRVPPAVALLAVVRACLATETTPDDRLEMSRLLPRVLRALLATGAWSEASEALRLVRGIEGSEWSEEAFVQELLQPGGISRTVEQLDPQGPASIADFVGLAHELRGVEVDWLTLTLSESQSRIARQMLAEAIAARVQDDPTRLAPWLSDPRWYVVRNVVHILGWVGGAAIVPMLQTAARHTDPRVTSEVVAALRNVELRAARPVLVRVLDGADTNLFCQVLQQLSVARDPQVSRHLVGLLTRDGFLQRPARERRAVYAAIASTGGDEVVPDLEAALTGAHWFDHDMEVHRHAVARCLARIGTLNAAAALEVGLRSNRAPVRQACEAALRTRRAA